MRERIEAIQEAASDWAWTDLLLVLTFLAVIAIGVALS